MNLWNMRMSNLHKIKDYYDEPGVWLCNIHLCPGLILAAPMMTYSLHKNHFHYCLHAFSDRCTGIHHCCISTYRRLLWLCASDWWSQDLSAYAHIRLLTQESDVRTEGKETPPLQAPQPQTDLCPETVSDKHHHE